MDTKYDEPRSSYYPWNYSLKNMKNYHIFKYANGRSLSEINGSIVVPKNKGFWQTLLAYTGPGALVAVGYMDPGNWVTSINGGQSFHYILISVILLSSMMAMLFQYMAGKLGIVTQMDLAQSIRLHTDKVLSFILWIITELAIMATDVTEVIGAAIALNLLFSIPLIMATFITVFDVLILLFLSKIGFRKVEVLVSCLILLVLLIFVYQVFLATPNWKAIWKGLLPNPFLVRKQPVVNGISPLTGSLGIIGATIMPHNFYLHSGICQVRKVEYQDSKSVKKAVRFTTLDSNIQLVLAFFVNSLLLIMGASVFKTGVVKDSSFFGLYAALNNTNMLSNHVLISVAKTGVLSTLFAVALLASGQNSTITDILTGQIVMEGFVKLKMSFWVRRIVTRLFSIFPVLICVSLTINDTIAQQHYVLNMLMENSQIFLALAVPFSLLPLLILTDSEKVMGKFKNNNFCSVFGWISALILIFLDFYNLPATFVNYGFLPTLFAKGLAYFIIVLILILLGWMITELYDLHFTF